MKDQDWIEYGTDIFAKAGDWFAVQWEAGPNMGQVLIVASILFVLIMAALRWRAWRIITAPAGWLSYRLYRLSAWLNGPRRTAAAESITFEVDVSVKEQATTAGTSADIEIEIKGPEPNGPPAHLNHCGKAVIFKDHLDPNAEPEAVYEEYEVAEASLGSEGGTIRRVPGGFQITQNTPAADDGIILKARDDGPPASEPMLKPVKGEYRVGDIVIDAKKNRGPGEVERLTVDGRYIIRFCDSKSAIKGQRSASELTPSKLEYRLETSAPYSGSKPDPLDAPATKRDIDALQVELDELAVQLRPAVRRDPFPRVRVCACCSSCDLSVGYPHDRSLIGFSCECGHCWTEPDPNPHRIKPERDPLINPKALDVVDTGSVTRTVTRADEFGVSYTAEDEGGYKVHQQESLASWRRRCSNGTVVKRGPAARDPRIDPENGDEVMPKGGSYEWHVLGILRGNIIVEHGPPHCRHIQGLKLTVWQERVKDGRILFTAP